MFTNICMATCRSCWHLSYGRFNETVTRRKTNESIKIARNETVLSNSTECYVYDQNMKKKLEDVFMKNILENEYIWRYIEFIRILLET